MTDYDEIPDQYKSATPLPLKARMRSRGLAFMVAHKLKNKFPRKWFMFMVRTPEQIKSGIIQALNRFDRNRKRLTCRCGRVFEDKRGFYKHTKSDTCAGVVTRGGLFDDS